MAAKPLDPGIAERVVADWRTGEYSQRQLADKHKISNGKAAQLTKGVPQDGAAIVSAGIEYRSALAAQDERMVSAVTEVVDRKVARMEYLNDAAIINVREAMTADCADQQDYRHRATTIKSALEVVDPQRGTGVAVQINNSNQSGGPDLSRLTYEQLEQLEAIAGTVRRG